MLVLIQSMVLHKVKRGSQFAQGMENTKGQARSSGSNVAESGNSGLKSVSSVSPGEAFSSGFAKGISNGEWNVQNVASSLARGAFEALKATLNVNSPSKLTRDQGGKPFSEGFALGIQKDLIWLNVRVVRLVQRQIML